MGLLSSGSARALPTILSAICSLWWSLDSREPVQGRSLRPGPEPGTSQPRHAFTQKDRFLSITMVFLSTNSSFSLKIIIHLILFVIIIIIILIHQRVRERPNESEKSNLQVQDSNCGQLYENPTPQSPYQLLAPTHLILVTIPQK